MNISYIYNGKLIYPEEMYNKGNKREWRNYSTCQ